MAFLFDQRTRLLRESWTADALAQELYAMISADVASNTLAPVSISLPVNSPVAPIQIGNYAPGQPIMRFLNSDGSNAGSLSFQNFVFNFTDPNGNTKPAC